MYELENIAPELRDPGRFTYEIRLGHASYTDAYVMPDSAPPKPDIPKKDCRPGSHEEMAWDEYELYWAAVRHQVERINVGRRSMLARAEYILLNCVSDDDRIRILEPEDWEKVQTAAIAPEVALDDIEAALRMTYEATYAGQPMLEALGYVSGSQSSYLAVRAWENKLMVEMGLTEDEYTKMDVGERARKICAIMLPEWSSILASEEMRKKNGGKK